MSNVARTRPFQFNGLMLDPARQTERHEFYFDLLPQLAQWGYNTLWWHFSDDEGFAQKLDSHPELATPFAFSKSQARRFVRSARQLGIDVVPEVESLGHAFSITRLPQYAHLFNGRPYGHNAVCPSQADTLPLMKDLIQETAELFGGQYLHAGLDEADLGDCPHCARRGKGKPPWWVFSRHALAIHRIVRDCGRRMIIWADPVEHHPQLLKVLPKDIILAHWHYGAVPAEKIIPSVEAGFEIVCVPAISGEILQPAGHSLQNVADHVALAMRLRRRGCLGMVACWWESFRNLRDTYPFATAYAGQAGRTGRPADRQDFAQAFAADYFGLRGAPAAGALRQLHELSPQRAEMKFLLYDGLADLHEALKLAAAPGFSQKADDLAACARTLLAARSKVNRHREEFDAYVLSALIQATAYDNGRKLLQAYKSYCRAASHVEYKADRKLVAEFLDQASVGLSQLQRPLDDLARAAAREWDRTRYRRDAKKDGSSPLLRQRGARAILVNLLRCASFHRTMAADLRKAIIRYRRGGAFPGGL